MNKLGIDPSSLMDGQANFGDAPKRISLIVQFAPIAGFLVFVFGIQIYRPLDRTWFVILGFVVFLAATLTISAVQKRIKRGQNVESYFPIVTWLAVGPVILAGVVVMNGALDPFPITRHSQVVTRKWVSHGRSTSYHIEISS
jgi:hypothetical protein